MLRVKRYPVGYVEVNDNAIVIGKMFSRATIPLKRVQSVEYSSFTGRLHIETGSKRHDVIFWRGKLPERKIILNLYSFLSISSCLKPGFCRIKALGLSKCRFLP